jgi:hypothetical protein
LGAFFCPQSQAKKPGFPLQVLGSADALLWAFRYNPSRPMGFSRFARFPAACGVLDNFEKDDD